MPLSGNVLTGIIVLLFLQRNQERRQSADEPTIWELYQRRWRSWVDEMDINEEERQALIAQGFNGILASTDGTYGKSDAQLCVCLIELDECHVALGCFAKMVESEFYTGFKKIHGWKLLVYVSHFRRKIFHIQVGL